MIWIRGFADEWLKVLCLICVIYFLAGSWRERWHLHNRTELNWRAESNHPIGFLWERSLERVFFPEPLRALLEVSHIYASPLYKLGGRRQKQCLDCNSPLQNITTFCIFHWLFPLLIEGIRIHNLHHRLWNWWFSCDWNLLIPSNEQWWMSN